MDESVLKLGAKLMQQLLDGFLYHDLSLSSFMHRFHLIVMQHYISTPVSFLCCHKDQVSVNRKKQRMHFHLIIENLRILVSISAG